MLATRDGSRAQTHVPKTKRRKEKKLGFFTTRLTVDADARETRRASRPDAHPHTHHTPPNTRAEDAKRWVAFASGCRSFQIPRLNGFL